MAKNYKNEKDVKDIFIVRKDKMLAGYDGNLEHVIVTTDGKDLNEDGSNGVELVNGLFVTVGNLATGEREVKNAKLTGTGDTGEDVLFIHNSEVMYDERLSKLDDFVIPAGKVARAYRLYNGDIMTFTEAYLPSTVKKDDVLVVGANGKLVKLGTDGTAKVKFLVIENSGNQLHYKAKAFAVQVIRD